MQVDDGDWHDGHSSATPCSDNTWRQWVLAVGRRRRATHTIRVRATDGTGETQTDDEARPDPDGATGWHTRRVTVSD